MISRYEMKGEYDIEIKHKDGKINKEKIKNRIMNVTLNELIETLIGNTADIEIQYLAVGTDATAVTNTDAVLGAEVFRTAPTNKSRTGTGEAESVFYIFNAEAVTSIKEIGIFGGSSATASADTGTLLSRVLWSKEKTDSMELKFTRTDTIERV